MAEQCHAFIFRQNNHQILLQPSLSLGELLFKSSFSFYALISLLRSAGKKKKIKKLEKQSFICPGRVSLWELGILGWLWHSPNSPNTPRSDSEPVCPAVSPGLCLGRAVPSEDWSRSPPRGMPHTRGLAWRGRRQSQPAQGAQRIPSGERQRQPGRCDVSIATPSLLMPCNQSVHK